MRIAWLTPEIPYPPIGGRNGVYNRIVQMSKYNEIYLFSIAYNGQELATEYEMEPYCEEVHYYDRSENKVLTMLKSLVRPYSVASRTNSHLINDLKKTIKSKNIDLVIVDFPNMALNLLRAGYDGYCTLNQHNNEYRRMRDMYEIKSLSYLKRVAYLLESYRLEWYEKKLYNGNYFNSITFFSTDDFGEFKKKWVKSCAELQVFPLGANRVEYTVDDEDIEHNTMLFVGRLDEVATTNVEGILWFCNEVLPIISRYVDAKLIIAGANPCERVNELQNNNITIIPNYKNLEDVYKMASIVVLPLLSGGGVKGKLLEASAFEKIIITTPHGIEGTRYVAGEHALLGESASEIAEKCVWAINNIIEAQEIARKSKKLFEQEYDWVQIGKNYNLFLEERIKVNK